MTALTQGILYVGCRCRVHASMGVPLDMCLLTAISHSLSSHTDIPYVITCITDDLYFPTWEDAMVGKGEEV